MRAKEVVYSSYSRERWETRASWQARRPEVGCELTVGDVRLKSSDPADWECEGVSGGIVMKG